MSELRRFFSKVAFSLLCGHLLHSNMGRKAGWARNLRRREGGVDDQTVSICDLEADTKANARLTFGLFDVDGSGYIERVEMKMALELLNLPHEEEDVDNFMSDVGSKDDGGLLPPPCRLCWLMSGSDADGFMPPVGDLLDG